MFSKFSSSRKPLPAEKASVATSSASSSTSFALRGWQNDASDSTVRKRAGRSGTFKDDITWHQLHRSLPPSPQPSSSESSDGLGSLQFAARKLHDITQRYLNTAADLILVDETYQEYAKIRSSCSKLYYSLAREDFQRKNPPPTTTDTPSATSGSGSSAVNGDATRNDTSRRKSSVDVGGIIARLNSSNSSASAGDEASAPPGLPSAALNAIKNWESCTQQLLTALRRSLRETYAEINPDTAVDPAGRADANTFGAASAFSNKPGNLIISPQLRREMADRVKSTGDIQLARKLDLRFQRHDIVREDLQRVRNLILAAQSSVSPDRPVVETIIAARGDTILEFATPAMLGDSSSNSEAVPVRRYRVSSYMLSETSPLFASMFTGCNDDSMDCTLRAFGGGGDEEARTDPAQVTPVKCIWNDDAEVSLYRLSQPESDQYKSLTILLHAAHHHNDKVPREVSFEQFVAIAQGCLRYQCTSPLELVVEHRWLPQWVHKGIDDMPDGLLIISYAFGIRELFTRMSKSAILNIIDENDLNEKPWPQEIKNKIWAVRYAKLDQVYACCVEAVQEYISPRHPEPQQPYVSKLSNTFGVRSSKFPTPSAQQAHHQQQQQQLALQSQPRATAESQQPRCPKGSRSCDATNLGWLMLFLNEHGFLPHFAQPVHHSYQHSSGHAQRSQSLSQVVEILRTIPSPPLPAHRGVCDPVAPFRAAVNDIFNSVHGLTLFEINGKSHGWALSEDRQNEPQRTFRASFISSATGASDDSGSRECLLTNLPESLRVQIFYNLDSEAHMRALALASSVFYDTFKRHEKLMYRVLIRRLDESGYGDDDGRTLDSDDDTGVEITEEEDTGKPYELEGDDWSTSGLQDVNNKVTAPTSGHSLHTDSASTYDTSATTRQPPLIARISGATSAAPPLLISRPEIPMTDEEARRILWPDPEDAPPASVNGSAETARRFSDKSPSPAYSTSVSDTQTNEVDKFLAGEKQLLFSQDTEREEAPAVEEKTLVVMGQKQLTSEHVLCMGLVKPLDQAPEVHEDKGLYC